MANKSTNGATPVKAVKPDPLATIMAEIRVAAGKASEADKSLLEEIHKMAKSGVYRTAQFNITPAVAALLFLEHNSHNRDFEPSKGREMGRRMSAGLWKPNNHTLGFYDDSELEDGQHRLSGAAVSNYTLVNYPVVFGVKRDAIGTVDCGFARDAASHAKLKGITDAKNKQYVARTALVYMARRGVESGRSPDELATFIEIHNPVLERSLELGLESTLNRVHTVLTANKAAVAAFLCLHWGGWNDQRVREDLLAFQAGESLDGESSPLYRGSGLIEASVKSRDPKNRLSLQAEVAVVVYSMTLHERGIKAISEKAIRTDIKQKFPPDPTHPDHDALAAD